MTQEISTVPIRVKRGSGWTNVDYTLRQVGEEIVPVASDVGLEFSAGGPGMVSLVDGNEQLTLDWPGFLPTPTLQGDTAVYADVLPGVDMLLRAVPGGYTQVLRVEDAVAASNPALDQLRFPAQVNDGAAVVETAGGGFSVLGSDGQPVLASPAPTMWDSAGRGPQGGGEALGEGDALKTMPLDASNTRVVVSPDSAMLSSPDTVYPVFIDPQVSGVRNEWAMVQKEYPSTEFYKWSNSDDMGEGVGFQNANGISTKRLIWEFGIAAIPNSAEIQSAHFRVDQTHSWSCTQAPVRLDRVERINSGTNWNNQPAKINGEALATSSIQVRLGNTAGDACKKNVTTIAFTGDRLAGSVENALPNGAIALRLSADESSTLGWKRFQQDAVLSIVYNRAPYTPAAIKLLDVESGRECNNFVPSRTSLPSLSGKVDDPELDAVDGRFTIQRYSSGAWSTGTSHWVEDKPSGSIIRLAMPPSAAQANGSWVDGRYRFTVAGRDSYGAVGPTSAVCEFFLDSVNPLLKIHATTTRFSDGATEPVVADQWIPAGNSVTFKLDPAGSVGYDGNNDVVSYQVRNSSIKAWNGDEIKVPAGTPGELKLASSSTFPGEHWLEVVSIDRAGRLSATARVDFRIMGARQKYQYLFDSQQSGVTAPIVTSDAATGENPGPGPGIQLINGATLSGHGSDDLTDFVLNLTQGGHGWAGAAAETSAGFSVSSWVQVPEVITSRRVIVSQQDNALQQTFSLALEPGCGAGNACAVFTLNGASSSTQVRSTTPVVPGKWFVVAGSYDSLAAQRRIRVWVGDQDGNSVVQTNIPATVTSRVSSQLLVGAEATASGPGSGFRGQLEDLRFYRDEVSDLDVSLHVQSDNPNHN